MNADVNESKELYYCKWHCATKQRGKRDIAFFIIFRLKNFKGEWKLKYAYKTATAYSKLCRTSKMERFRKIVNGYASVLSR